MHLMVFYQILPFSCFVQEQKNAIGYDKLKNQFRSNGWQLIWFDFLTFNKTKWDLELDYLIRVWKLLMLLGHFLIDFLSYNLSWKIWIRIYNLFLDSIVHTKNRETCFGNHFNLIWRKRKYRDDKTDHRKVEKENGDRFIYSDGVGSNQNHRRQIWTVIILQKIKILLKVPLN